MPQKTSKRTNDSIGQVYSSRWLSDIGYALEDDSEAVYADEIRHYILNPARERMVSGQQRGGKGSR